jgi:hypothetical protein
MHYGMGKFTGGNLKEPDPDKYEDEVKAKIIEARRDNELTAKEARDAWEGMLPMLQDYENVNYMFERLINHEHFEKVFGDYEGLPHAERVRPPCEMFWENIWKPFTEFLADETKES